MRKSNILNIITNVPRVKASKIIFVPLKNDDDYMKCSELQLSLRNTTNRYRKDRNCKKM